MSRLCVCITAILAVFFTSAIYAQIFPIDKGSINAGGDIRVSSLGGKLNESDNGRLTTMEVKPYYGYFVIRQLSVGGKLLVSRSSQGDFSQTQWGAGPVVKYFFGDTAPKRVTRGTIYFFLETGLFLSQNIIEKSDGNKIYSGYIFEQGLGMCFMITNSVGYISGISFQYERMQSGKKVLYGNAVVFSCGFTSFLYKQY